MPHWPLYALAGAASMLLGLGLYLLETEAESARLNDLIHTP